MRTTNILILGGARSGKSRFAQELAEKLGGQVLFVATAAAGDKEMRQRIEKHKKTRPANWRTIEVSTHIGSRIEQEIGSASVVLVDCITLLVSNILCQYSESELESLREPELEAQIMAEIKELVACMQKVKASFIVVSNEVGLGLVPDNRLGRVYRDMLGKANQVLAQSVDEVFFMVAGLPVKVKPAA